LYVCRHAAHRFSCPRVVSRLHGQLSGRCRCSSNAGHLRPSPRREPSRAPSLLAGGSGPLVCWCPPRCCAPLGAPRPAVLCPPAVGACCPPPAVGSGPVSVCRCPPLWCCVLPCSVVRVRAFSPLTRHASSDVRDTFAFWPPLARSQRMPWERPTVRLRVVRRPA